MSGRADGGNQAEVVAFLSDPASYPARPKRVERFETHGARVFLAGDEAWKIKRAVQGVIPVLAGTVHDRTFATRDRRPGFIDERLGPAKVRHRVVPLQLGDRRAQCRVYRVGARLRWNSEVEGCKRDP